MWSIGTSSQPTSLRPSKLTKLLFDQSAKLLRDFALFLFQRRDHAGCDRWNGVDLIAAGNDVLLVGRDEANHLIVPGRLFEFLKNGRVFPFGIVGDRNWFEMAFDHFDEFGVGEDFGPKDLAAASPGNFLKKQHHRFAGFFGSGESGIEVARPFHGSEFDRLRGFRLATGGKQEKQENELHAGESLRDGRYSLQVIFTKLATGV